MKKIIIVMCLFFAGFVVGGAVVSHIDEATIEQKVNQIAHQEGLINALQDTIIEYETETNDAAE